MDRRESKRTHYFLDANITSGNSVYDGFIENVSRDGMEYLMTSVVDSPEHFIPRKVIDMHLTIPTGDELTLKCEVVWHLKAETYGKAVLIGLKIISPPSAYKNLIEDLHEGC